MNKRLWVVLRYLAMAVLGLPYLVVIAGYYILSYRAVRLPNLSFGTHNVGMFLVSIGLLGIVIFSFSVLAEDSANRRSLAFANVLTALCFVLFGMEMQSGRILHDSKVMICIGVLFVFTRVIAYRAIARMKTDDEKAKTEEQAAAQEGAKPEIGE